MRVLKSLCDVSLRSWLTTRLFHAPPSQRMYRGRWVVYLHQTHLKCAPFHHLWSPQVTRHGLEYPQFFARLYQLLVPEVGGVTCSRGKGRGSGPELILRRWHCASPCACCIWAQWPLHRWTRGVWTYAANCTGIYGVSST